MAGRGRGRGQISSKLKALLTKGHGPTPTLPPPSGFVPNVSSANTNPLLALHQFDSSDEEPEPIATTIAKTPHNLKRKAASPAQTQPANKKRKKRVTFHPDSKRHDGGMPQVPIRMKEFMATGGGMFGQHHVDIDAAQHSHKRLDPEQLLPALRPRPIVDELDSIEGDYDAVVPNDYEQFCIQRTRIKAQTDALRHWELDNKDHQKKLAEIKEASLRQQMPQQQQQQAVQPAAVSSASPQSQPVTAPPAGQGGPPSLDGLTKAQKMMAKMGWRAGQGLGKDSTGLLAALVPTGAHNLLAADAAPIEAFTEEALPDDVTQVVRLANMVGRGEIDDDLEGETAEECGKFGPVDQVKIWQNPNMACNPNLSVCIFVKFAFKGHAYQCFQAMNGRFFAGRQVKASYFALDKFGKSSFNATH